MADPAKSGTSPAIAALFSGAVSILLTLAATLVSLRNEADKKQLFEVLNWVMYATGGATFLMLLWIISLDIKRRLDLLGSLHDIDRHVARQVRLAKRTDHLVVFENGNGRWTAECEVEAEPGLAVGWVTFSVFAAAAESNEMWRSVKVRRLQLDGRDCDVERSYIRKSRAHVEDPMFKGLVREEGVIRIPVTLEKGQPRRHFKLEVDFIGSMPALFSEESHAVDTPYITDELDVHVTGGPGLEIFPSPTASHLVEASHNKGEDWDPQESILQSGTCRHRDGIHWRSKNTKLGYRYEIKFVARRVMSSDPQAG
ncbi:hypothetical protein AB0A63_32990 [Lentzea sp. NPDC042327]|uniref:hypothetical protein n=1 Tax=Lentzea sp. NPDC042327 TaxID=3154801 RepID=UPI0033D26555